MTDLRAGFVHLSTSFATTPHPARDRGVRLDAAGIRISQAFLYRGHETRLLGQLVKRLRGQQDSCRLAVLIIVHGRPWLLEYTRMTARVLALVLVFVALALRIWQYAAGTSMWIDELWIASNVLPRSIPDLLSRPLDFGQVAPPGFLLLTKWSTLALGSSEYALRLLPFLAGLASVVLFWRLACRALDGAGPPIALAVFAWNIALLRYTSEVKQYEVDAAAALALTLLALRLRDRPPTLARAVAAGAAGLVVVWVSHASALVLAGLGGALAICWLRDQSPEQHLPYAVVVSMWAIAAAASVLASIRHLSPSTAAFMKIFWREGFVPWPPAHLSDALFGVGVGSRRYFARFAHLDRRADAAAAPQRGVQRRFGLRSRPPLAQRPDLRV